VFHESNTCQMKKSILIVEFDIIISMSIEKYLKSQGYKDVLIVDTLEKIHQRIINKKCDLVLISYPTEIHESIEEIEAKLFIKRKIPVIYLTTDESFFNESDYYLTKPFNFSELLKMIESILSKLV